MTDEFRINETSSDANYILRWLLNYNGEIALMCARLYKSLQIYVLITHLIIWIRSLHIERRLNRYVVPGITLITGDIINYTTTTRARRAEIMHDSDVEFRSVARADIGGSSGKGSRAETVSSIEKRAGRPHPRFFEGRRRK